MLFSSKFSIAILILVLGAQIFRRSFLARSASLIWKITIFGIFSTSAYWIYMQYIIWKRNYISKFFLPPYQSINYFIMYSFREILAAYLLSFIAAAIVSGIASYFNKKYDYRFFEKEEIYIIAICIFLVGYPNFIFYIPLVIVCGVILSAVYSFLNKGRAPFYYLWIPAALFAIIMIRHIAPESWINIFAI